MLKLLKTEYFVQWCTCSQKAKCVSCVRNKVHPKLKTYSKQYGGGGGPPQSSIEKTANSSLGCIGILHLEKVTNTILLSVTFLSLADADYK